MVKVSQNFVIGLVCFTAFVLVFAILIGGPIIASKQQVETTTQLPLLAITGIMALLAALALVTVTFSLAGLADPTQALGLPEGSIRAVIALSLIVLFAITAIFLYSSMAATELRQTAALSKDQMEHLVKSLRTGEVVLVTDTADKRFVVHYRLSNQASEDFAKQIFAVIGTLMTAVASFYFASRAVATVPPLAIGATVTPAPVSTPGAPILTGTLPTQGKQGTSVNVVLSGSGLQQATGVKLSKGNELIIASSVIPAGAQALAKVTLPMNTGVYDVEIATADGRTARLPQAFTVTL